MDCFIKKIFQRKIQGDELIHQQFQKFSKGEFPNRAMIRAKNSKGKFTISTTAEYAKDLVMNLAEKLEKYKCVIGPSEDGGYYLIALKQNSTKLFNNISWSTPYVLQQTLQAAEREKISVFQLSKLYDIDTIEELKRLQNDLKNMNKLSPDFPSNTWDVLARIFHKFEQ